MNENLVNKKTEDDDELEEYEELPEEKEEDNNKDKTKRSFKPKNKATKFMLLFMVIFMALILIIWVISLFINKNYTYDEIENILKDAAVEYFEEYKENLPEEEGSIVEVDSSNLSQAKKMKELSEYTGEDVACTGTVQVEKTDGSYLYTPYLDCGEKYKTQKLSEAVISQGLAKQGQYGLYKINGEYVYRGENLKNYVELDLGVWKIVKVTSKGNVVLIRDADVDHEEEYDNRYNLESKSKTGINNYSASRVKDYLQEYYTTDDENDKILSKNDKKHLVNFNLCTGKRSQTDTGYTNEKECSVQEKNVKIGLLTASDYMKASLDSNCVNTTSKSCGNYNFLVSKNFRYWLATTNSENSYEAYYVDNSGQIKAVEASDDACIRPVIYLNENTMFKSGKGTESSPYKIK